MGGRHLVSSVITYSNKISQRIQEHMNEKIFLDRSLRIPWFDHSKIKDKRIAVIGIGNTGSYTAVMLYGLAPKEICLIDKDVVEATNIQRQFMYSEKDVNRPKVEAAKDFLLSRFKGLKTKVKTLAADVRYLEDFDFDFVFSCVDNMPARKAILEKCLENRIPLIDMGLEFHESQAGHVLLVDKKRFPDGACLDCYFDFGKKREYKGGCIASGIPYSGAIVAGVAVGMFTQHIMRELRANYYFIDLNSCTSFFTFMKRRETCRTCSES